jgi:glutamine synthetase
MNIKAEYIWIDGSEPTRKLRSKTRILPKCPDTPEECSKWGFDGSSTGQAQGQDSDCILNPVYLCPDPVRGDEHVLVLCDVYAANGEPHVTNQRAGLVEVAAKHEKEQAQFGIEQEYTMFKGNRPLGWPESGYPAPQGPFYCGVGSDEVFGRKLVETHMDLCLNAGLSLSGINAEVMPGQWEFQIGPLGALEVSDQLIIARWLLFRCAEDSNVTISLDPKPVRGDWNGAGAHTNFSTAEMRAENGITAIKKAMKRLQAKAKDHINNYGDGIEQRLTGRHETCSHDTFRWGVADRGASIRIPRHVEEEQQGYFEDRRPCANIDPYVVTRLLLQTVLE